jgi:inner membrane protein
VGTLPFRLAFLCEHAVVSCCRLPTANSDRFQEQRLDSRTVDPLTHALTGATIAWAVAGPRLGKRSLLIGAAAALAPDLDVLIRSSSDPLLAIEHHRGFTHALLFAPVGAALVALLLRGRSPFRMAWVAAFGAWLSHGLLDAATTYGTQLFWPLSRVRVGLDVISIIDPLFTLFALAGVMASVFGRRTPVVCALAMMGIWLALGFVQRERAFAAQNALAEMRGESSTEGAVFPTIGNTLVWRSLYRTNGMLRMDRIRVPWFGAPRFAEGDRVPAYWSPATSDDLARFAWFSDGWLAADPTDPQLIGDARYSLDSSAYRPVWGIRLQPRTEWVNRSRERRVSPDALWREVRGLDPAFVPVQ